MLRLTCLALLVSVTIGLELSASLTNHWESFKSKHNKKYDDATEAKRKEVFKSNVEAVLSHNLDADLGSQSYSLGINEYSDLSHDEFKAKFLGLRYEETNVTDSHVLESNELLGDIPESVDWSSYCVVKNQKSCGSCWAFATTGAIESHMAIYQNKRVTLSEQNLVDCAARNYFNFGCNGGNPSNAYRYIIKNGGIDSDICYPYEMKDAECRYAESCNTATILDYKELPKHENKLINALATIGPVAIGMDAGQRDFQLYKNGVYDSSTCTTKVNHAVLAVGYGTENGKPYYLIKNSWGPTWGEKGFFKMFRGNNRCGVTTMVSYPIVTGSPAAN